MFFACQSFSLDLWMSWLALFTHSDSWAHAVASMRDSCLFIMQCHLTAYQYDFLATPKVLFLKAWFHFCRLRTAREPLGPHAVASQQQLPDANASPFSCLIDEDISKE